MHQLIEKINPGIRAKLSFFTAFLVIIIIGLSSFLYLQQQYDSLTKSFDREIRPLRLYTEKIVLDLENLSNNLLLIEDFRFRLKAKTIELKQYQRRTVQVVEEKSWFTKNILGHLNKIQNDLINTKDVKKIRLHNTYYSEYITERKIQEIEENIRSLMRDEKGNPITVSRFKKMQELASIANKFINEIDTIQKEIDSQEAIKNKSPDTKDSSQTEIISPELENKIQILKRNLETKESEKYAAIEKLNSEIQSYYFQVQKDNISDLGLNTDLIRIQSFNLRNSKVGFDTNIFTLSNTLNSQTFLNHPKVTEDWQSRITNLDPKNLLDIKLEPTAMEIDNRDYEIYFNPILRKPSIVHRAKIILKEARNSNSIWKDFFEEDKNISIEIGKISEKLRARLYTLRELRFGKPGLDKEYINLYKDYNVQLKKRSDLIVKLNIDTTPKVKNLQDIKKKEMQLLQDIEHIESYLKLSQQKEVKNNLERIALNEEILKKNKELDYYKKDLNYIQKIMEDWSDSENLISLDAFNNFRDVALYEFGILRFKYQANSYKDFIESQSSRDLQIAKFNAIRKWIYDATSETIVPNIKVNNEYLDPYEGGFLSRSRSEIEEAMWRFDSTPLFVLDENGKEAGLANELLVSYLAGFTRTIVDKSDGLYKIRQDVRNILFNSSVLGISAIGFAFLLSTVMVKNIRQISANAQLVGSGNLQIHFDVKSKDEIGRLSQTLNQMVNGLIEREKVKSALGKFVSPQIAEMVLKQELKLGGERKHCAILFSDIRSFTSISENLQPEEVVEFLNEYLTEMVHCVNESHGIVDKFIGDAVMATWGAAFSKGNDAENAVNGALLMRQALLKFNEGRGKDRKPVVQIGCGINYGPAIAGQIGSEERLEYTVIGDAVNLASRVEALNKPFGTDILITADLYELVQDIFLVEKMQAIKVKGKEKPQVIYAVLGRVDNPNSPQSLEELRTLLGIKFNSEKKGNLETKEEKFEIIS